MMAMRRPLGCAAARRFSMTLLVAAEIAVGEVEPGNVHSRPDHLLHDLPAIRRPVRSYRRFWFYALAKSSSFLRLFFLHERYRISLGCPVAVRTLFQTHPSGSTFLRFEVAMGMGTWVNSLRPETDHHVGPSCHTGMNGILSQEETEGGIIGIRRHAPYGVTRIDVLQADLQCPSV